jgi:hypothetical protein
LPSSTRDEAATLAEDNLLTFNPFAQADSLAIANLASHVVDAPAHGVWRPLHSAGH